MASSNGTCASSSRSTCTPSTRRTSATAWAIADCIRMPSTSSLSRPSSSTSSLSNWLIGNPAWDASTGVRSSSVTSESSTPQGCIAMWRGSPSSRSTSPKKRSSAPSPSPLARSSGRSRSAEPGVAGTDVGERLGDRVHLPRRHAEGGADVTDRVADPVGVHHRDGDAPLAAEAVEDRAVDLLAPGGLHVDVDVGQRGAQRRQEPLHQQAVADRVDPGDAEQVVDQAAGAGPAGGTTDAHLADQVGDVGDGQEVGRVAQGPDGLELVVEPLPDPHPRAGAVAPADRRLAAGAQQGVGRCGAGPRRGARAPGSAPRRCRGRCAGRARTGRRPPACGRATASPPARCRPARRGGRSRRPPRASACRT